MTTILLDTHVIHWWSAEPDKLSKRATTAIEESDELAVSAITWFELAWLAANGRIDIAIPIATWLREISQQVHTIGITPTIAEIAVMLPSTMSSDPADRIIFASAIDNGWKLVSKDQAIRAHRHPGISVVW